MTRCIHCEKTWTAMRAEHCPACHETFSGQKAGDRHRVGSFLGRHGRRCIPAYLLRTTGLVLDSRGIWAGAEWRDRAVPTRRAPSQTAEQPSRVSQVPPGGTEV